MFSYNHLQTFSQPSLLQLILFKLKRRLVFRDYRSLLRRRCLLLTERLGVWLVIIPNVVLLSVLVLVC
ncbi:hypothetical protein F0562_009757 [Nyssa sinensis]|uniref:Uncharacterized protein n=1 Tax=Nyssa sinensis TaxID=561372 RepID=A0A5J4ZZK3_9ASTE|nr:hypothetical protein F0562_009757 [Nyssa sinensis]